MKRRIKKGVALRYKEGDAVPVVTAKAQGYLVQKMLQLAENNKVTVYTDADLTESLHALPEGGGIPPELYRAVAEVIAYCYRMNEGGRLR